MTYMYFLIVMFPVDKTFDSTLGDLKMTLCSQNTEKFSIMIQCAIYFIFLFYFTLYNLAGIKAYDTEARELVMEPAIKWAGNPNITLVLKVLSLSITVQVRRSE